MHNPLQRLDLEAAPLPEEAAEPNPPSSPAPSLYVWQDRLFDPIGGRIPEWMPLMLLRADDPLAAELVRQWARGLPQEETALYRQAMHTAAAMQAWQQRPPTRRR